MTNPVAAEAFVRLVSEAIGAHPITGRSGRMRPVPRESFTIKKRGHGEGAVPLLVRERLMAKDEFGEEPSPATA